MSTQRCVKCGTGEMTPCYHQNPTGFACDVWRCRTVRNSGIVHAEHLVWTCQRCHYWYITPCADVPGFEEKRAS